MLKEFLDEASLGPQYLLDWCFLANLLVLLLCVLLCSNYEIWDKHGKLIKGVWCVFLITVLFFMVVTLLSYFDIWAPPRNLPFEFFCWCVFPVLLYEESKIWKKQASAKDKRWYKDHVAFYDNDIAYYESIIKEGREDHAELSQRVEDLKREREKVLSERPHP